MNGKNRKKKILPVYGTDHVLYLSGILTTAMPSMLTQNSSFFFHFREVELRRLFFDNVIFIIIKIIIIIDNTVSLPLCVLHFKSKGLDTSLTEDIAKKKIKRTGIKHICLLSFGHL